MLFLCILLILVFFFLYRVTELNSVVEQLSEEKKFIQEQNDYKDSEIEVSFCIISINNHTLVDTVQWTEIGLCGCLKIQYKNSCLDHIYFFYYNYNTVFILIDVHTPINGHSPDLKIKSAIMIHYIDIKK